MGFFESSEAKEQRRSLEKQLDVQKDSSDVGLTQQMVEQGRVAYDPQVSAMLLECKRRFLPWKPNYKKGTIELDAKYSGLVEPFGEEALGFLTDEEKLLLYDIDANLGDVFAYGEKYGFDGNTIRLFNNIVNFRTSFLVGSRTTGKPQKLAKSFYVQAQSRIERGKSTDGKQDKFLGIF